MRCPFTGIGSDSEDEYETVAEDDTIEFLARKEKVGAIPEPVPAHSVKPQWFRDLAPNTDGSQRREHLGTPTVKRCMPFMESISLGWIVRAPEEVEIDVTDNRMTYKPEDGALEYMSFDMLGDFPVEKPVFKWKVPWVVKAPEDFALLELPLLNRFGYPWRGFSGITTGLDEYWGTANPICQMRYKNWQGIVDKGTPLTQIVPLHKSAIPDTATVRAMDDEEEVEFERETERRLSKEQYFKDSYWEPFHRGRNDYDDEKYRY